MSSRSANRPLARRRLDQQRLTGTPYARPEAVVAGLLAVQSQDYLGAKWAVAQRTRGATDADVQEAFQAGRILRTHVMRPTWHFVSPSDIRWLLDLTSPRVHALNGPYYRKHGLDAGHVKRSRARMVKALSGGRHLTREELARTLGAGDSAMRGNRLAYVVMRAELDALICCGPMRGKQHTYALLDERVPQAPRLERDEALAALARRYVTGHGPAQARDLAWWSGLTVADARRGFEANQSTLDHEVIDGKTYWFASETVARRVSPVVHLLPNYDELVMAFKDRRAMLDSRITPDTSVLSAHFVVIDGCIVGGWRRAVGTREVVVSAQLLRRVTADERQGLEAAATRYGRSLGLPARIDMRVVS